ncbi:hypothetical protein Plhal304r1_c048g0130061 [Plasmopara halstedii]
MVSAPSIVLFILGCPKMRVFQVTSVVSVTPTQLVVVCSIETALLKYTFAVGVLCNSHSLVNPLNVDCCIQLLYKYRGIASTTAAFYTKRRSSQAFLSH